MDEFEEIIKLDGEDFLVVDKVLYEGKNYIYVNSTVNTYDFSILEEYKKEDKTYVKSIQDEKYDLIMSVFAKKIIDDK